MKLTLALLLVSLGSAGLIGCASPLADEGADVMRERIRTRLVRDLESGTTRTPPREEPTVDPVAPADESSPLWRYLLEDVQVGRGLDDEHPAVLPLGLRYVLVLAMSRNLDSRIARLTPEIQRMQVVEAEANFDWTAFASTQVSRVNRPQPASTVDGVAVGVDQTRRNTVTGEAGVRKQTELGGTVAVSTGLEFADDRTPGQDFTPSPSYLSYVALSVTQPLLRGAGPTVTRAEVEIAENVHLREIFELKRRMLALAGDVEVAYWELVFAHYNLAIQEQLLAETVGTRRELADRRQMDVNPVQIAQAEREVQLRRTSVIRARAAVHDASDRLKRLANLPDAPLLSDSVIQPVDHPVEVLEQYSMREAALMALREQPELQQLQIDLDNLRIQRVTAESRSRPQLDLIGEVRQNALAGDADRSYERLTEEEFIELLVGLQFQQAIGNRAAEAAETRVRLTQMAQRLAYESTVQDVLLSVKQTLREMHTAYEVLRVSRRARVVAAEHLESLGRREQLDEQVAADFLLDLKLRAQERLADAETRELRAAIDYNIAMVRFHQATGTLLAERRIAFRVPGYEGGRRSEAISGLDPLAPEADETGDGRDGAQRYMPNYLEKETP